MSVAFSDDGKFLASGGADRKVFIYNSATGEAMFRFYHESTVRVVLFSPVQSDLLLAVALNEFSMCTNPMKGTSAKTKLAPSSNCTSAALFSGRVPASVGSVSEGATQRWPGRAAPPEPSASALLAPSELRWPWQALQWPRPLTR